MDTIPLLSHGSPTAVIAYRGGVPITAQRFLSDARRLGESLPRGVHVLNVCTDRYRFTVGLAACLMTQRVSLLPSTQMPEMIRQLKEFAPDAFCLTDDPGCDVGLPRVYYPEELAGDDAAWTVPEIPVRQLAAIVFTSGSTGMPLPFQKTWGRLACCVRDGAPRLRLLDGQSHALIGTVPPQHMYGFESTVLLALMSGNSFAAERPFYPADIAAALHGVPRPRALITTPVHLRTLLASDIELPPVELIVSATAPLDQDLARNVEAKFGTVLLEIYGSTETGQIAIRRTSESAAWRLWPEVRLQVSGDQVFAQGGHVEQVTAMQDVIEIIGDDEFLLHGRAADMVNVAGKRSSFAYLNAQLNAIPGVTDGAFFLGDGATGCTGVARLGAVVVAPALSVAALTEHLRLRIDPAFLPRPLIKVERLPRNATGKLPQHELRHIVAMSAPAAASVSSPIEIPQDHPAFAGHFPQFPVLPGAALLDEALLAIERARGIDLKEWRIASVKFLDAVRPGDALRLEHAAAPDSDMIRFTLHAGGRLVASGGLSRTAHARQARAPDGGT